MVVDSRKKARRKKKCQKVPKEAAAKNILSLGGYELAVAVATAVPFTEPSAESLPPVVIPPVFCRFAVDKGSPTGPPLLAPPAKGRFWLTGTPKISSIFWIVSLVVRLFCFF